VFVDTAAEFPEVTYVDAYTLFSDGNGRYAAALPDEDGDVVTMRAGDGVHLSADGGDLMARAVFYRLDVAWNITGQAVPDQPKTVIRTPGSSQIEGTYRPPATSSAPAPAPTTLPPPTAPPPPPPEPAPVPTEPPEEDDDGEDEGDGPP
jgi:hypothetical protein